MDAKNKLIVALDVPTFDEARKIVETLGDTVSTYKVGYQLFTAYGPFMVRFLQAQGKRVFLDLKFHDIPNTVANAVSSAVGFSTPLHDMLDAAGNKLGTDFAPLFMMTVHTQGGLEMLKAAADAAQKRAVELKVERPLIVGVTVLTSDAMANVSEVVLKRAKLSKAAGLDGVVSSAQEAAMLRREMGKDFILVTPGIRPANSEAGDQKRVETPLSAIKNGASFLVVGRPIVQAKSPRDAAKKILEEIQSLAC